MKAETDYHLISPLEKIVSILYFVDKVQEGRIQRNGAWRICFVRRFVGGFLRNGLRRMHRRTYEILRIIRHPAIERNLVI